MFATVFLKSCTVFLSLIALCITAAAERVIKVADGDTITVIDNQNRIERVRLWGIDAPEKKQPYGNAAREHLAERIAGKEVRLETRGRDRYGRIIAVVFLGNENENLRMVSNGYAWHYVAYARKAAEYAAAEKTARERKLGLWTETNPTAPWEYRRKKRTRSP